MARPKGTTRAKKAIEKYEYEKLMTFTTKSPAIKQQRLRVKLRRAFTLLFITGCRVSEIVEFTTKDLKEMIEKKEYSLTNATKTSQSRLITLSDKQVAVLKTLLPENLATDFKLFDATAGYITIKCNDIIHKCLGKLYSTHSFRAGYITRLANNGENIELIRSDIGHTKIATTARYIKVTEELKRAAKEKLDW